MPQNPQQPLPAPLGLEQGAALLQAGGLLVYPTETFFAIGCMAANAAGVAQIAAIKKRDAAKPMPLLAASREQAAEIADISAAPRELLQKFWPGPLTVLLPAKGCLSPLLKNTKGQVAVRVTSGPMAAALALACASPLTASSANFSGMTPAQTESGLDSGLFAAMRAMGASHGFLPRKDEPCAPLPSTIVAVARRHGKTTLRILREGAISRKALQDAGFLILQL